MSFIEFDPSSKDHVTAQHEEPRLPTRRGGPHEEMSLEADRAFPSFFQRMFQPRRRNRKTMSRRWARHTAIALCVFIALIAASVLFVGMWLRHSKRTALPQMDGTLQAAGLHQSVAVTRDAQGVPSLQAGDLDDLLFAQGFVTAQDRLWQMDVLRRHAAGELAEILGSKLVEHDRMQRVLQIRAAADRAVAALNPDQLHQLQAYANGVNAFMEQNGDRLPIEFHLLRYRPEPWTPRDTLMVSLSLYQDLSTGFPVKMKREALSAHLPAGLVADLYPVGSWRDRPPTQPPPNLVTPKPDIEEIPLDDTQVRLRIPKLAEPGDLLKVSHELQGQACDDCRAGSNNWAVSGAHSASGFPLLSNDMHLSLSVPDIWYEAGLHCPATDNHPALDVVGFTLPGAPYVIVGRNAHVAWSFTNLGGDVQDLRIEHTRESGNGMEYQKPDGTWSAAEHVSEKIRVRGGHDVSLDVLTTTAKIGDTEIVTPVISQLYPSEKRVISLAWTAYDPANLAVPFLQADTANSGAALVAALQNLGGPSLNLIYADDAKHIGYHALGRIPVRGPAERRARTITNPFAPSDDDQDKRATPETEEGSEDPTTPQASLSTPWSFSGARLLDAAYRPTRRRPQPQHRPEKKTTPPAPEPQEEPIKPLPPPLDYTIGSAISSVPVDALDRSQQWSGYVPFDQLPSITDPANGILATANARITADDYPYFLANNWAVPYRAERIYKLLSDKSALRPSDMLAMQNDVHSALDLVVAHRLIYAVDHASPSALSKDTKRLRQAANVLRSWDGKMSSDSAAAAIVMAFRDVFWPTLLSAQIVAHGNVSHEKAKELSALYQWGEGSVAMESLLQHAPNRWLPPGVANWNDLLTTTLMHGLAEAHAPGNLAKWRYGAEHPVAIEHPVFSQSPLLSSLIGVPTGTGKRETGGDAETIRAAGLHFGPSERFDADLADANNTLGNITTGQSGNPASAWYLDQFVPWLQGTSFALPLHPSDSLHRLTLTP